MSNPSEIQARREELRDSITRFISGALRRKLGWSTGEIKIDVPTDGKRSVLYFATPPTGDPIVLRLIEDAEAYGRHWRALELAGRHDAPIPRCVYRGVGWLDKLRHGHRFIAESRLPGDRLDHFPASGAMREAVARSLARLHTIESANWGYVGSPERKPYVDIFRKRIDRRLKDLGAGASAFSGDQITAMAAWFDQKLTQLQNVETFQLCHLHLGKDDILYDPPTDRASLIDCGALQFSRASRDLANFQIPMKSWISKTEEHAQFIETYLAHSPPTRRAEVERERPFFEAFLLLSRLRKGVRHASEESGKSGPSERHVGMRGRLLSLVGVRD